MKKLFTLVVVLAALILVGYLFALGKVPGFGTDRQTVIHQTARFFECLKFKEYEEAANFHDEEDRKKADIPRMIEELFKIPPEQLDIQEYTVIFGEVDSSGELGRAKTRCVVKTLNTDEERKPEIILYWKKENGKWYLKLRSSLERFR